MKLEVDLVASGSGTLLDALAGAVQRLEHEVDFARTAGTSGGAVVACAVAMGMTGDEMLVLGREVLSGGRLLDPSLAPWERWGFFAGDRLHALLRRYFPGRMADAALPWCVYAHDLWRGETVRLSSWETPDILAADAVRASIAIPLFFKGVRLPVGPDGEQRFLVDGGVLANFAMDAFDDEEGKDRLTIGVRFVPSTSTRKEVELQPLDFLRPSVVTSKVAAYLGAIVDAWIEAGARQHVSEKNWSREIRIDAGAESGMDFWLDGCDFNRRAALGRAAADAFVRGGGLSSDEAEAPEGR